MLRKTLIYSIMLTFMVTMLAAGAAAQSSSWDACTGAQAGGAYAGVSKVKPGPNQVMKVKPYSGLSSAFGSLSGINPMSWGPDCCLPMPATKQYVAGPEVFFARLRGEARRGTDITGLDTSIADFDNHLGLTDELGPVWSVKAHYQVRPRWGIRYSFTPISIETTHVPTTSFTFGGQSFTSGTTVASKWYHWEHRAGLVFDVAKSSSGVTSAYIEWIYIQDKLQVGGALGGGTTVSWDDDKNLAGLGLEFQKCLKNFRGNTLSLTAKGGVAFLDDTFGYDAEAALSYMIPVKRGRFGFIKGGYRYAQLKKEKNAELFDTTMDGAFLQVGFLF